MCSRVTVSRARAFSVSESEVRTVAMSSRVRASLRGPREGSVMTAPSREVGGGAFLTDERNPRQSLNIAQGLDRQVGSDRAGRPSGRPVEHGSFGSHDELSVSDLDDGAVDEERPVAGLPRREDERDAAVLADEARGRRADAVDEQTVAV